MAKNTNFEQFSGEGRKYAPKAAPRATKAAEKFAEPKAGRVSEETDMIDTYRAEKRLVPIKRNDSGSRGAQSTDHMN